MTRSRALNIFHPKVQPEPNSGCWLWTGMCDKIGYGRIFNSDGGRPQQKRAHRCFYEAVRGRIPDGLVIDHLCRTPACVNPDHLEAVTPSVNTYRQLAAIYPSFGTHCPKGHVYVARISNGRVRHKCCRTCQVEYSRMYYRRAKERGVTSRQWNKRARGA